jgi:HK97 gp10 family phage protein
MPVAYRVIRVNAWNYPRMKKATRAALVDVVGKYGKKISKEIRKSFRLPKHGRLYYYKGKRIRASAPGESPAIRSGNLDRHVYPIISNGGLQITINPQGQGVYYAAWLENGTTRMAARPHLKPAFDRYRAEFLEQVRTQLAKALTSK